MERAGVLSISTQETEKVGAPVVKKDHDGIISIIVCLRFIWSLTIGAIDFLGGYLEW